MKRKLPFAVLAATVAVPAIFAPTPGFAATNDEAKSGLYFSKADEKGVYYTFEAWSDLTQVERGILLAKYGSENVQVLLKAQGLEKITTLGAIAEAGKPFNETAVEYKDGDIEGTFTDVATGEDVVIGEDTAPVVKVESVSAIDETGVTVTFTALTEAKEGATITVVDPSGKTVEVTPVNLEVGDTSATFDFVTAYEELPLGTFVVQGKDFDTAAIDAVEKVSAATNVVTLWTALQSDYFTGAKEDNITAYKNAIDQAKLDNKLNTVADVNKIIADVNKSAVDAVAEEAVVKKVADATNVLQLLNALKDPAFARVNADWITDYSTEDVSLASGPAVDMIDLASANYFGETAGTTIEKIQDAIDAANLKQLFASVQAAEMNLDADKVATARTLVNKYGVDSKTDKPGSKEYGLDILKVEDALIAVNNASTNASLKSALTNLDTLENSLVKKYAGMTKSQIVAGLGATAVFAEEFDAATALDANLTDYRNKIKATTDIGDKNQRSDIQALITSVNNEFGSLKAKESKVAASTAAKPTFTIDALKKDGKLFASMGAATAITVKIGDTAAQNYEVDGTNDFNSGTPGELKIKATSGAAGFDLSTVGTETEATITFTSGGVDYTVKAPVKVTAGLIAETETEATFDLSNIEGTYASGEDVEFTFTLKDASNNTIASENGTYASTITVGTDTFYQNITFVDGKTTVKAPARTAVVDGEIAVTFTTKDNGGPVTINSANDILTIEAGEFSKLDVAQQTTTSTIEITATDGVNAITDFGTKLVNIKAVKVVGETETPVTVAGTDYQGNLTADFTAGVLTHDTELAAGTYKVTVTVNGVTTTKTITVAGA